MIHGRYLPCNHNDIYLGKILEITEQRRTMYLAEFQSLFWSISSWEYSDMLWTSASVHCNRRHSSNPKYRLLAKLLHNHKRVFSHLLSCRFSSKFDLNSTSRGHQNPYHRHASLTMVYYLNCKTTLFKVLTILLFNSKITYFNLFVNSLNTLISLWSITSRIYCRLNKTG